MSAPWFVRYMFIPNFVSMFVLLIVQAVADSWNLFSMGAAVFNAVVASICLRNFITGVYNYS